MKLLFSERTTANLSNHGENSLVCCSVVFLSLKISHLYVTQKTIDAPPLGVHILFCKEKTPKAFISRFEPNPARWLCANPSPLPFTVQFLMLVRGILFFRIWTSCLNHFQALFAKLYVFTQALSKTPPLCSKNLECPPLPPFCYGASYSFGYGHLAWLISKLCLCGKKLAIQAVCLHSSLEHSLIKKGALSGVWRAFDVIYWYINIIIYIVFLLWPWCFSNIPFYIIYIYICF